MASTSKILIVILVACTSLVNVYAARTKQATKKTAASKPQRQVMKQEAPFKPTRGRGRQIQLNAMSQEEINAEAIWRLENNRISAKACRKRKKAYVKGLEKKVVSYEERDKANLAEIDRLKQLKQQLEKEHARQETAPLPLQAISWQEVNDLLTTSERCTTPALVTPPASELSRLSPDDMWLVDEQNGQALLDSQLSHQFQWQSPRNKDQQILPTVWLP